MAVSELRLIKNCMEFVHQDDVKNVPPKTRGLYVLFKYRPRLDKYDVVYIGMAGGEKKTGISGRLRSHLKKKANQWTHFSAFEVWDNIREDEVRELEGILRHIFRKDSHANKLGIQKSFKKLTRVSKDTKSKGGLKR